MPIDPNEYLKAKLTTEECAKEVMTHLHKALVGQEITLKDGSKARVESFYPPETDETGEVACGVDVILDNGVSVEFTMKNTGFGRPMGLFRKRLEKGWER